MKKILSLILVALMLFACAACFASCDSASSDSFKIGVICIGDESEGYTKAHMDGIKAAAQAIGLKDDQIIWYKKVLETSDCYDKAKDLVSQGCSIIFSNSYGHQDFMVKAAKEYPNVTFVAMTGDYAAISGCSNFCNAFTGVYESRYVSGVVAGLKLKELVDNGTLTAEKIPASFDAEGNIKIGYVGAFPYAEVVSGYTAFYLGIKSVISNVAMSVVYTGEWFHIDKENSAAKDLITSGCVIIGQHADSTGAPAAVQEAFDKGTVVYSVGYNIDMLSTAPTAALTSASNTWEVYYEYAIKAAMKGEKVAQNWCEGYKTGAVNITALGPNVAAGTAEKVQETVDAIKNGTLHVFDCNTFTITGANLENVNNSGAKIDENGKVTSATIDLSYYDWANGGTCVYKGEKLEAIKDGYFDESTLRSAPYFALRIDGIKEN